jgi:hypothetical protein
MSSLTRYAGFGDFAWRLRRSPHQAQERRSLGTPTDAAKPAQDCVLAAQLERVSGGDRGGGAVQAVRAKLIFTTEARRKTGDLTAKDAEVSKEEWEMQEGLAADLRRGGADKSGAPDN